MAWRQTIGQNVLFCCMSLASASALSTAFELANVVIPHFVPTDRSYASLPSTTLEEEPGRAASMLCALAIAAASAVLFTALRRRLRARVLPVAIALIPLGLGCAVLSSLGSADAFRTSVFVPLTSLGWLLFARACASGRERIAIAVPTLVVGAIVIMSGLTLYDAYGPDAAARARDRAKIAGVRYAGSHYARYPGSPWTRKPPETTAAEMAPLHLTYEDVDRDHYRLCTTFERAVSTDRRFPHGVGKTCFLMTYDDSY